MKSLLKNKRAAFEMSMTTVVIIVLAMTMLILGLTLVRKVMTMGTGIIDITDAGVKSKLNKMLGEEGRDVTIGLPDKTAVISPGNKGNAPLVVDTSGMGSTIGPEDLKYVISLSDQGTCDKGLVESYFVTPLDKELEFDDWEAGIAYASILMEVPKGAKLCTQKIGVEIKGADQSLKSSFTLDIAKTGLF